MTRISQSGIPISTSLPFAAVVDSSTNEVKSSQASKSQYVEPNFPAKSKEKSPKN